MDNPDGDSCRRGLRLSPTTLSTSSGTVATIVVAMMRGSKTRSGMRAASRRPDHAHASTTGANNPMRGRCSRRSSPCISGSFDRRKGAEATSLLPPHPHASRGPFTTRAMLLTDPAACPSRSRARCARTQAGERSSGPARPQPGSSPCSRARPGSGRAR